MQLQKQAVCYQTQSQRPRLKQQKLFVLFPLHLRLIQRLTRFRTIFGLQFLKSYPVETIHPRVYFKEITLRFSPIFEQADFSKFSFKYQRSRHGFA